MKKLIIFSVTLLSFFSHAQEQQPTHFSLDEAVAYTLQNNYEIVKANLDLEIAKKKIWETTATGLPHIDGEVGYNYNIKNPVFITANGPLEVGSRQTLTPQITVSQLIFSGPYLVGLQSAKAFEKISSLAKEKTESELTQAVIQAYSAVIIADENIALLQKNIQIAEKNLHDITEIYKAGLGEEQSVDQMNYTMVQLNASENYAKRQRQNALNSLKFIMGIPQDNKVELTSDLEDLMDKNIVLVSENPQDLIIDNIDYQLADHQVTINELQVKLEKSQALPSLSTFFNYARNYYTQEDAFLNDLQHYDTSLVGLKLNIPIFSSLERSARTQQAQLELEKAKVSRQKSNDEILQKINNNLLQYQNAVEQYETAKALVELSRKIYKKEQIKFFEGISTSFDLSNAEQQLYEAENKYIQAAIDVINTKTELYKSMGKF